MSVLFASVMKQARRTFDKKNLNNFKTEFLLLKQLIDKLTMNDLNMNPVHASKEAFKIQHKAPCSYIPIFENDDLTVSIFILDNHYTMPLHDHPMMHGILKSIKGTIKIQSYSECGTLDTSVTRQPSYIVSPEPIRELSSNCESVILTPTIGNFHEITAVDGPAAFFDVLSPPYDANIPIYGPRRCTFYHKRTDEKYLILERIPAPSHYYCDDIPYERPDFIHDIFYN